MDAEIIVVGAGHGGLVAAYHLARHGFDVHILEKAPRAELSWNWHDNVPLGVFEHVGVPPPAPELYTPIPNYTFVTPDEQATFSTHLPPEEREIRIHRRELAHLLVDAAHDAGATLEFETPVKAPVIKDGVVTGVTTTAGDRTCALVVDSAGIDTPVRPRLPPAYAIPASLARGETFYLHRTYFEKRDDTYQHKVYFMFHGLRGISWVNTSGDYADVLLGQIDPFQPGQVEALVAALKRTNPCVGDKVLLPGQYGRIPIRRALPKLVGDGYAVVGDAACMAKPINGSGVENAMIAGHLLAQRVIALRDAATPEPPGDAATPGSGRATSAGDYSTRALWPYQRAYFSTQGADMAGIDVIKSYLMTLPVPDVNFLIHKRIIMAEDIEASLKGEEVAMPFFSLLGRVFRGFSRLGLLLHLKKTLGLVNEVKAHHARLPAEYSPQAFQEWARADRAMFERFTSQLQTP